MKVLMTGFTTRQTGSTRLLYEYIKCADIITEGMAAAGHEVTCRIVDINEPASELEDKYDAALVGICPPTSMGARFTFGALEALKRFGTRAALWADDWSLAQVKSQLNTAIKHFDQRMFGIPSATNKNPLNNRVQVEAAKLRGRDYWLDILRDYNINQNRKILLWFLHWGDPVRFMRNILPAQPVMYDPTNFCRERPHLLVGAAAGDFVIPQGGPVERQRQWVNATLQKHDPWREKLGLKWPVLQLGNKRQGQDVLRERDVMAHYALNWGVLCPRYLPPGTGWWRVRYVQSAIMGNVLLGSTDDAGVAGKPYRLLPRDVEGLDNDALASLAAEQGRVLFDGAWKSDRMVDVFDTFIRGLSRG